MPAAATDNFQKVGIATATTLDAPGYTIGGTSLTVVSTTNMPTDTGITVAMDVIDANGDQVAGSYNEYVGTVASATSITNLSHQNGTDRNYSAGTTTRVYMPVSAERENRLVEGILVHADQDGTLKAGAVDVTAVLADGIITQAKLSTGATEIGGAWQTWTPTFTNFSLGNGTINKARYKQVGKHVDFELHVTMGTTSSVTGQITFSLPITAAAASVVDPTSVFNSSVLFVDVGTSIVDGRMALASTTTANLYAVNASATYATVSAVSSTIPFTWSAANGDNFRIAGSYEAA